MGERWRPTPKAKRRRLAQAELLLRLAVTAERWGSDIRGVGCRPFSEWGDDDPMRVLCSTYGLTPQDLAEICSELGERLERQAMRSGYDEHWERDLEEAR